MRNLVLLSERRRSIAVPSIGGTVDPDDPDDVAISSVAYDPSAPRDDDGGHDNFYPESENETPTPSAFYLTTAGILIATSSAAPDGICWTCSLDEVVTVQEGAGWFDVTYVDDLDALVCLSRRGAIVTVEKETGNAELVGEFDNGIEAGGWSPDKEILALYTHTDSEEEEEEEEGEGETTTSEKGKFPALMTMNAQFEVLAEVVPESNVLPSASTDASVSMCWRPDGTAIAISNVDASDATRRIRTYSRDDLALLSIGRSEDGSGKTVPNLLAPAGIAWSGLGCSQLITAVQRKGKRADTPRLVVFFEPNGLRHKEFKLRPDAGWEETVVDLSWNCQSDLLAVTLICTKQNTNGDEESSGGSNMRSKVQLWHRSNYHWYCKFELRYSGARVSMIDFDEERPHDLAVAIRTNSSSLEVHKYTFVWDVSTELADGTAASIDGSLLNFTPFQQTMIPPPMYFSTISMDHPVRGVCGAPSLIRKRFGVSWLVHLCDGSLCLLGNQNRLDNLMAEKTQDGDTPSRFVTPSVIAKIERKDFNSMRQFLVINANLNEGGEIVVRCIAIECNSGLSDSSSDHDQSEKIVEIDIFFNGTSTSTSVVNKLSTERQVLRIANWSDNTEICGALVELCDGSILEYESSPKAGVGTLIPSNAEPMLEPCPWIAGLHSTCGLVNERRVVVGMSNRSRLYFGERVLSDACSSYALSVAHQFLSYATLGSRSHLRFIPLSVLAAYDPLMGSEENIMALGDGYEPRNVERGSRVVTILPEAPTAVLQLPRGNLEGVYPRALVLPFAMRLIADGRYGEAMEVMRRQKIDLNLFCDMDPTDFLEGDGIANFISQVGKIDYLNLFISCLFDGDITQWKYQIPSWFYPSLQDAERAFLKKNEFDFSTKVNQVCSKMRDVLLQFETDGRTTSGSIVSDDHFLLPILSTFAKQHPPKLEDALSMIRENAISKDSGRSKKSPLLGDRAQSAIQYLAFLADYTLLFDTALGMYDFDLARAVARNSQMDPKVYLPLLKRLRSLPEFVAKYEVDLRLERFDLAFTHLVRSGDEDLDALQAPQAKNEHFSLCLSFIEKHNLPRLGLELYDNDDTCKNRIMESLGERLLNEGDGLAALSIFCAVEPSNIEGAKRAAQECGDWQSFFALLDESTQEDTEESRQNQRIYYADEVAEEIAAGKCDAHGKRESFKCASRILLDYGDNILGAVDMLIKGEMWSEGRRVARLHERADLVKKCVDAAVSYGQKCIDDFDKRAVEFTETNKRYQKCLVLRKDAKRKEALEGADDGVPDDAGSMFSMASNASNTSLRSNMSGSSVGSVTSVSSVISAGATTTFSMISEEDANKHKSKYNRLGGKKKKKKKAPKRQSRKIMPGSEKELMELVGLLTFNCINDDYLQVISETISFLLHVGKQQLARALYDSYNDLATKIDNSQTERKESTGKEIEDARRDALREGRDYEIVAIDCEIEIDALSCKQLPSSLRQVFSYI